MTVDRRTDGAPRRDVCELSGASGRRRRRVSIGCTSRETDDTAMRLPATTRRPDVRRRSLFAPAPANNTAALSSSITAQPSVVGPLAARRVKRGAFSDADSATTSAEMCLV